MILKIEKAKTCQALEQMKSRRETNTNHQASSASPLLQERIALLNCDLNHNSSQFLSQIKNPQIHPDDDGEE